MILWDILRDWDLVMGVLRALLAYSLLALDALVVFSVLFGMLFLGLEAVCAVFGETVEKYRGRAVLPLLAAAALVQHSPVEGTVLFILHGAVGAVQDRLQVGNIAMFLTILWLAGVFLCLFLLAVRYLRLQWEMIRLPDYPDADAIARACEAAGVRRVRVKSAGKMRQAASWGIFRACVLVPDDFAARFTPEERHWIYLHELTHCKRRDPLRCIALALWRSCFWFDPASLGAARRIRHDFELACDDAVVRRYGADPLEYARLVAKTAALERGIMPIGFSSGAGSFGQIGRRVGLLVGKRGAARSLRRIVCGAVAATALFAAFVWCCAAAPEKTSVVRSVNRVIVGEDGVAREFMLGIEGEYGVFGSYSHTFPTVQELGEQDLRSGGIIV